MDISVGSIGEASVAYASHVARTYTQVANHSVHCSAQIMEYPCSVLDLAQHTPLKTVPAEPESMIW